MLKNCLQKTDNQPTDRTMTPIDDQKPHDTDAIGVVCSALVQPSFVFGSDDDGEPNFRSLVGPGGWECYLGEPEDALWCRDGADAMAMLNELVARVEILSDFAKTAPGRLPSDVQSALWPNSATPIVPEHPAVAALREILGPHMGCADSIEELEEIRRIATDALTALEG